GTYVNGKRINGKQLVYPGDRLQVGPICFVVDYSSKKSKPSSTESPEAASESEEDLPVLELAAEEAPAKPVVLADDSDDKPLPLADDSANGAAEHQDVLDEIDKSGGLHLPETEDLRDILAQMEGGKPPRKDQH